MRFLPFFSAATDGTLRRERASSCDARRADAMRAEGVLVCLQVFVSHTGPEPSTQKSSRSHRKSKRK
jgi:hypothetical protein